MEKINIDELAYFLKRAKQQNKPQPIFFLGAGASKTGRVPLAGEIAEYILKEHADNPRICKSKTYAELMSCLLPEDRNQLLKSYVDDAKINVTHIYLAQLLKEDYVDYILTVNFDNLILRALSLFNIFPSTYDMAILNDFTTTVPKEKSVFYLHGQSHGLWLLNTPDEMKKVDDIVPRILHSIKNGRPWIFIGYSGSDPIFEHIKKLGRFDNHLYWVTFQKENPQENVKNFLSNPNTNAYLIEGYDADSFMLRLNSLLDLPQPDIISKPFSALKDKLDQIVDIDDKEHYKTVKERMNISLRWVSEAIKKYEEGAPIQEDAKENIELDLLKKEVIDILISDKYNENTISQLEQKAKNFNDDELYYNLAGVFNNWGNYLGNLAETKTGQEAEDLFHQAFEKYQKAVEIKPDLHETFNNWGGYLGNLAETKTEQETEDLFNQAFEKYQKAVEIKPDLHETFCNWGVDLGKLAKTKIGQEAEDLFHQAFEKYQKAVEIKPDLHEAFHNWGSNLTILAKSKSGQEAKKLLKQALEKCQKAVDLGGKCYNLACSYALIGNKEEALRYLEQSLEQKEVDTDFIITDEDWAQYLQDEDFEKIVDRYKK